MHEHEARQTKHDWELLYVRMHAYRLYRAVVLGTSMIGLSSLSLPDYTYTPLSGVYSLARAGASPEKRRFPIESHFETRDIFGNQ
jgi:hypothetical protein